METPARRYGRNNISMSLDGSDIVIRIDTGAMALNPDGSDKAAGTPNPTKEDPTKKRVVNLIATSGGFATVGECRVSVNVTSL